MSGSVSGPVAGAAIASRAARLFARRRDHTRRPHTTSTRITIRPSTAAPRILPACAASATTRCAASAAACASFALPAMNACRAFARSEWSLAPIKPIFSNNECEPFTASDAFTSSFAAVRSALASFFTSVRFGPRDFVFVSQLRRRVQTERSDDAIDLVACVDRVRRERHETARVRERPIRHLESDLERHLPSVARVDERRVLLYALCATSSSRDRPLLAT